MHGGTMIKIDRAVLTHIFHLLFEICYLCIFQRQLLRPNGVSVLGRQWRTTDLVLLFSQIFVGLKAQESLLAVLTGQVNLTGEFQLIFQLLDAILSLTCEVYKQSRPPTRPLRC
uniref:Uncharacterized protein n=1 Tax=Guillardia theta TaxID=55529 RepID=A0A7S4PC24_GUITH|mmetsp:Transcript_47887/g.150210  ORF Transcript_47887/g.150210 Transcript_47887/m.150210 type:complete len:114 (+) Transcript_47887:465-806(+)